jgi:capsular polysaccharide biosynthesis protein
MVLLSYLRILGRYWWVLVLATMVTTGAAMIFVTVSQPVYSAEVRVVAVPSSRLSDPRQLVDMTSQLGVRTVMGTLAHTFTSAQVKQEAQAATNLTVESAADYRLEADVLPETSVIRVSGQGPDAGVLARYINATVEAAVRSSRELFRVIDLHLLEPATAPELPTSPNRGRDLLAGFGIGLVLGMLLTFAIEAARRAGRKQRDVRKYDLEPSLLSASTYEPAALSQASSNRNGGSNGLNRPNPAQMERYNLRGRHRRSSESVTTGKLDDLFPG